MEGLSDGAVEMVFEDESGESELVTFPSAGSARACSQECAVKSSVGNVNLENEDER